MIRAELRITAKCDFCSRKENSTGFVEIYNNFDLTNFIYQSRLAFESQGWLFNKTGKAMCPDCHKEMIKREASLTHK